MKFNSLIPELSVTDNSKRNPTGSKIQEACAVSNSLYR